MESREFLEVGDEEFDHFVVLGEAKALEVKVGRPGYQDVVVLDLGVLSQELLLETAPDVAQQHVIQLALLQSDLLDVLRVVALRNHVLDGQLSALVQACHHVQLHVKLERLVQVVHEAKAVAL